MKFGLLYEQEKAGLMTETGGVNAELQHNVFMESLEQARLADEVGFDTIWAVEHHSLGDFSFSSAPEIFLTAVAAQTKRIRVGHGVVLLPFGYNHPVKIAERIATLDHISEGRLEFGTGRSASIVEMEAFGVNPATNRQEWDEALRMITTAWKEDIFSWESESFSLPPRPIVPKPYQDPHPPIWMAGTQPESVDLAADRGIGILHFTYSQPEHLREKVEAYRERSAKATPVGQTKNTNFGAFTMMFCGENDQDALEKGGPGAKWYVEGTNALYSGLAELGEGADSYKWYIEAQQRGDFLGIKQNRGEVETDVARMSDEAILAIGGPEKCTQIIKEFEARGVDQMIMLVQHGATKHEDIMASLRRFGEEVIPHFRNGS